MKEQKYVTLARSKDEGECVKKSREDEESFWIRGEDLEPASEKEPMSGMSSPIITRLQAVSF